MKRVVRWGRLTPYRPGVLALGLAATLPLLLFAAAIAWRGAAADEARVVEQRVALARAVALTAESLVAGNLAPVRALAVSRAVTEPGDQPDLQNFLKRVLAEQPAWEWLSLYDQEAWNIASTWAPPRSHNIADRPYFHQVMATSEPVVSPALTRPVASPALVNRRSGDPEVVLAVPVQFARGDRGALVASLSVAGFGERLQALYGREDVQIIVLDQQGHVFIHPDPATARALAPMDWLAETRAVLAGKTGSRRLVGPGGVEHLVAYAPAGTVRWGVVVAQPTAAALGPVQRELASALGALALTAAITGLLGWSLSGRLARSVEVARLREAQAEEAAQRLRHQLDFTAAITRDIGEGVYALDRAGRLTFLNPAAERLLGWSEHDLRQRLVHDVVHPHLPRVPDGAPGRLLLEAPAGACPLLDAIRRGAIFHQEDDAFRRKDGTLLAVAYTASPIVTGGEVFGTVLAFHDITARKRTEAALRQANRLKDDFLAVVSHELRTPITAVMGYADVLLRQAHGGLEQRLERHVLGIREAARRQLALINDLLDVSMLEAGAVSLHPRPVEPPAAVTRAVAAVEDLAADQGVELRAAVPRHAVPPVLADPDRLQQILSNLLSNAIKFTPRGGTVTVAAAVEAAPAGGFVGFRVQDTGIGIAAEHLPHVWDRFYQGEAPATRRFGGTGLGLTIVRRLVEQHGGRVEAASPGPGQGSTFTVWLPAAAPPAPTEAPEAPERGRAESGEAAAAAVPLGEDSAPAPTR